jgi:(2Fe-2S) ferredoxin
VIRWLKDLPPPEFSVSKCGCTRNCVNGPNVVVGGKGKEERVLYGRNTVGIVVTICVKSMI